jgi:predicted nuclease with RNAse H fold
MKTLRLAGVDLGGKRSGTTALCFLEEDFVTTLQAARGSDGHAWLDEQIVARRITHVFIDAPLSLPGVYRGLKDFHDYHFRKADKLLGAMSPLFLGGLTASAIELAAAWQEKGIVTLEVYPSALVKHLQLQVFYKPKHLPPKTMSNFIRKLKRHPETRKYFEGLRWKISHSLSRHEADAILCLLSGLRFLSGEALAYGYRDEGLIWV